MHSTWKNGLHLPRYCEVERIGSVVKDDAVVEPNEAVAHILSDLSFLVERDRLEDTVLLVTWS
jgi:hypothetical protein